LQDETPQREVFLKNQPAGEEQGGKQKQIKVGKVFGGVNWHFRLRSEFLGKGEKRRRKNDRTKKDSKKKTKKRS